MFVEIVEDVKVLPNGEKLEYTTYGLLLNVDGEERAIPAKEMGFELDAEDPNDASLLYVTYEGVDYQFDLPDRDSVDWEILQEILDPE